MYVQQIISNVRFRVFNEIQFVFPHFLFYSTTNPKKQSYIYIRKSKEDEEGWKGICVKCECTRKIKTGTTKTANLNIILLNKNFITILYLSFESFKFNLSTQKQSQTVELISC